MILDGEKYLQEIGLPESVKQIHRAITEKFPIDGSEFDAWYTNRIQVLQKLENLGKSTAKEIRQSLGFSWEKDLQPPLRELLETKNLAPKNWEDGPDGTLVGMAIVLAAWIANQTAQKSGDNPADQARNIFEEYIRPLILASMDVGIKMAGRGSA